MLKRGVDVSLLDEVVDKLRKGIILEPKYNDHMLKGNFALFHECHIRADFLLIYLIEDDILTLTLVNTGRCAYFFNF